MDKWITLASDLIVDEVITHLKQHGINASVAETADEAKQQVLSLIPKGVKVWANTSQTLDEIGVTEVIEELGEYHSVRKEVFSLDQKTQAHEMKVLRASPEWAVGSVHAVTEEGQIMIASRSGSQIANIAYGADHVILVVSTMKIVKDTDEGMKRIYERSLPLESERVKEAHGLPHSDVWKILLLNGEMPGRISVVLVKEQLGY